MIEFKAFKSIARLNRTMVITEKIDGTNALVFVGEDGTVIAGSKSRFLSPEQDNFGFAAWVRDHADELVGLGPGYHYGEWWGSGINRGYGLIKGEKRFSLFNTSKWAGAENCPACCSVVPVLRTHTFDTAVIREAMEVLREGGSFAAPGFMQPEGVVIYHPASNTLFKATLENDEVPKRLAVAA